jgi:hypothetical protein
MEVKLALATLVGQMHVALHPDNLAKTTADLIENARSTITMTQLGGLRLRMTPRVTSAPIENSA